MNYVTAKFVGVVDETQVAPPQGYTIRGEACKDECDFYGYDYTWCHKVSPSNLGNWRGSDYCSNQPSKYTTFTFVYINSNIWWQKNFASELWNMYFSSYMKEKTTKNIEEKCLYANQVKTKRKQVFWNLSTLNRPIVQGIYRI